MGRIELEVSENGEDFTTVYQETGWVSNGDDAGVKTIKFDAVNAKYVRLGNLFNSLTPYNMTLWEFEIYNMPPAENLAEKKPADADCEANPDSKFHITDGKLANMWQTANDHDSHWATVDLGDAVDLDNIIISWDGGAYPKNLKISLMMEMIMIQVIIKVILAELVMTKQVEEITKVKQVVIIQEMIMMKEISMI